MTILTKYTTALKHFPLEYMVVISILLIWIRECKRLPEGVHAFILQTEINNVVHHCLKNKTKSPITQAFCQISQISFAPYDFRLYTAVEAWG
jgi:hypothetical protein